MNEKQLEIIVNVVIVIIKVLRALNLSVTHSAYYHRDRCVRRSVHALQNRLHLRIGNLYRNHAPQKRTVPMLPCWARTMIRSSMERAFAGSTKAILPTTYNGSNETDTSSTGFRVDEGVKQLLSRFFLRPRM